MKIPSPDAAIWTAQIVHTAKTVERIAWQNWLTANTNANKAIFLAARSARIRAVYDWRCAKESCVVLS
ncbi:MAG: hypothetical protein HQM04_14245 [Magnetococcales bacterium]|nr:hypothetical protein [Magnetococcales bacterium]MBF0116185.1 hypothetical protein [Magnetococcales bacterium]